MFGLRQRLQAWFESRLARADTWLLTQRNIYILPTRAGLAFASVLVVMLLASINYQLSLGYVLTFLLAGAGFVSMHMTHNTLARHDAAPAAAGLGFCRRADGARNRADQPEPLPSMASVSAFADPGASGHDVFVDVPGGGQAIAHLAFVPPRRGLHTLPTLQVETRYPLGLFRAWTVWKPAAKALAWPRPEIPLAPWPASPSAAGQAAQALRSDSGEFDGVRAYRRGDALTAHRLEEKRQGRRSGQPRSRQRHAARAVVRLAAGPTPRHRAPAVPYGGVGGGRRCCRYPARPAPAGPRNRARQRRGPPPGKPRRIGRMVMSAAGPIPRRSRPLGGPGAQRRGGQT